MRRDTNCAQCGSAYLPCEQLARNAKKQWSDDINTSITTQLKDALKELLPSLPKAAGEAQDILSWACADETLKTDLLGATAEASPDDQEEK